MFVIQRSDVHYVFVKRIRSARWQREGEGRREGDDEGGRAKGDGDCNGEGERQGLDGAGGGVGRV